MDADVNVLVNSIKKLLSMVESGRGTATQLETALSQHLQPMAEVLWRTLRSQSGPANGDEESISMCQGPVMIERFECESECL